jgi:solute carrier family 10 (sodium/bile acid cotransporter), member 7
MDKRGGNYQGQGFHFAAVKDMLARFLPDEFTLAMAATVAIALAAPCHGAGAQFFEALTTAAIGLLFFLQGVRLSRAAIVAAVSHWRLHLVIFAATFVLFPLAGLALKPLASALLAPPMVVGLIFLCALPSTVQSSIAFTSIAGGNVAAALCSASASTLVGIVATPLLAGLLLHAHGGFSLDAVRSIAFQLLAPFVAGQALQRWIGGFVQRHGKVLGMTDRGSVLLMVYTVFSAATVGGIWRLLTPGLFAILAAVDAALLALMLAATAVIARSLRFSRADEIAIVFCGSKKSLISGIAMANVMFAGPSVSLIVLPLMIFHQIQLMACAALARRYALAAAQASEPAGLRRPAFGEGRSEAAVQ